MLLRKYIIKLWFFNPFKFFHNKTMLIFVKYAQKNFVKSCLHTFFYEKSLSCALRCQRLRPRRCALGRSRVHMLAESERRRGKIRAFDLAAGFDFPVARDVSRAWNVTVHVQLARNLDILGFQRHFARLDSYVSFAVDAYDRRRAFLDAPERNSEKVEQVVSRSYRGSLRDEVKPPKARLH